MNLNNDSKQLINNYIDEVNANLPKKMRGDITAEIRSLIMDALEDRTGEGEINEEEVLAVLKELGSPVKMAGSYHPHQTVIGPQMYAPFWMTLRWTFILMTCFYLLGFLLSWGEATQSLTALGNTLWELVVGYWDSALKIFAIIFLIFMILERSIPEPDWVEQLKARGMLAKIPFLGGIFGHSPTSEWETLVTTPKAERLKRGETIFEMVVILLVVILFNLFPHKVGAYGIIDGKPWYVPLLSPVFQDYLPWWNLYWLLTLGLNFTLLGMRRWTRSTRWVEFGLLAFSWILVYWIVKGPPILGLTPAFLELNQTGPAAIRLAEETLLPILSTLLKVALVVHLVVKGTRLILKLFQLVGRVPVLTFTRGNGSTS